MCGCRGGAGPPGWGAPWLSSRCLRLPGLQGGLSARRRIPSRAVAGTGSSCGQVNFPGVLRRVRGSPGPSPAPPASFKSGPRCSLGTA